MLITGLYKLAIIIFVGYIVIEGIYKVYLMFQPDDDGHR